jgi:DNA-directed RNA polymerase subunit RPC12/RpoP
MASEMLGRSTCPECGFPHAHVKIKVDKEGAHPYRHCPDCGSQYFTKNKQQGDLLRSKLVVKHEVPTPAEPAETPPAPIPEATKPVKYVFGVQVS